MTFITCLFIIPQITRSSWLNCNAIPIWPSPWIELYKLCSSLIFRQSSLIWPSCFSFNDQLTQEKETEVHRKKKFGGCSYWYFRRQITGVGSYLIIFKKPSRFYFKCLMSWYWYKFLAILHFFLKMILSVEFDTDMRAMGYGLWFLSFRIKIEHFRWSKGTDKRLTLIQKPFVVLRSNLTPHMTMKSALR